MPQVLQKDHFLKAIACYLHVLLFVFVSEKGKVLPVLGSICSYSNVCSVFAGLSGNTDKDVSSALGDIHHVREDVGFLKMVTIL